MQVSSGLVYWARLFVPWGGEEQQEEISAESLVHRVGCLEQLRICHKMGIFVGQLMGHEWFYCWYLQPPDLPRTREDPRKTDEVSPFHFREFTIQCICLVVCIFMVDTTISQKGNDGCRSQICSYYLLTADNLWSWWAVLHGGRDGLQWTWTTSESAVLAGHMMTLTGHL